MLSNNFTNDANVGRNLWLNLDNQPTEIKPTPPLRKKKHLKLQRLLSPKSPPPGDESDSLNIPYQNSPKISLNSSSIIRKKAFFNQSTTAVDENPSPQTTNPKSIFDAVDNQRPSSFQNNHEEAADNQFVEKHTPLFEKKRVHESEPIASPRKKKISTSNNPEDSNVSTSSQSPSKTNISIVTNEPAQIDNIIEEKQFENKSISESTITSMNSPKRVYGEEEMDIGQSSPIKPESLKPHGAQRKPSADQEIYLSKLSIADKDDTNNSLMLSSLTSDCSSSGGDDDTTSEITPSFEAKNGELGKTKADVSNEKMYVILYSFI